MKTYVIRYAHYLKNFGVSDFDDFSEAKQFAETDEDPEWTTMVVTGPATFLRSSNKWRVDVYNAMVAEGAELPDDKFISAETLFERMERWVLE